MEAFNLDIIPGRTCPVCHASQYDIGRTIRINLFDGVSVFTLSGAETVSLSVRKPDGNVVTAAVTNTSDNYVEFVTTEQMTACHGSNLCELKLEEGGDVIGTMNFILEVEQDPLEGGVQSASEIDNLQTQIAGMVATEVASQYDSANVIFDAAPTAGHGVGYAVTSEGVKNEVDQLQTDISAKQDITDASLDTDATTIVGGINEVHDSIGADKYSTTASYTVGQYCIYNNTLYRCVSPTSGAWDSSKWVATTITSLIESKANSSETYTKSQVDNALSAKEDSLSKGTGNLNANNLYGVNGYYRNVSGNISNCPNNDGNLIVIYNGEGNSTMQLFFVSTGETMYFRITWGAGTISWTSWKKITFTA